MRGPTWPTSPIRKTCLLLTAITLTPTTGSALNFESCSVILAASCSGVYPAATISLISGSDIFPSGRTVWVTRFPVNNLDELKHFVANLGGTPTVEDALPGAADMVAVRDLFAPETFYVPGCGVGFHQAYGTMSLDQFALMLYDAPDEIHQLIEHYNDASLAVCGAYAEAKISPFFFIGDDIAYKHKLMFSPRMLRELFFPYLKKMCDLLDPAGIKVIFHSDGDITSILPDLIECGVAGINPVETMAGMDVGHVKREYGRDLILVGGVDCSQVIPLGTPETIRREVKKILREGADGGGMFIGSSSEIVPATPLENIYAFYDACKEFGRYPLGV